jgi:GNAT superfamily N-acetyltransferase
MTDIPAPLGASSIDVGETGTLGLSERLGLISLIDEGMRLGSPESPVMADLFNNLWELVNRTVTGSRIDRLKPEDSQNGFRVFEINSETGENLCRLNTLYLKKPIPCYYLVFVEVSAPFRRKGLGGRILEAFRDFLVEKSAIGILENIIPEEDPTYTVYFKHAWDPVETIIGESAKGLGIHCMVYVPPALQGRPLREPLLKLLYHLKRKRAAIELRDNQVMVQRTLTEFKDLYKALLAYFEKQIRDNEPTPLMRFMFTRFVTKFIAFRRRISGLIGYTGGESMGQITLAPEIAGLPGKSYAPSAGMGSNPLTVTGDRALWIRLPEYLKGDPAQVIEALPNYRRPSLETWLKKQGRTRADTLTIGDLMDLGFDPTRLKEIPMEGRVHIFERIQARQLPELSRKKEMLTRMASGLKGSRAKGARILTNPPLLEIGDRGNAYVLRPRVKGIHWDEAVEQLHTDPFLIEINRALKLDGIIISTVNEAYEMVGERLGLGADSLADSLACFVSWDIEANRPILMIDFSRISLESVWMA